MLKYKEIPMKKYITLLLLTACLLASCSSAPADETENDTTADTIESVEETEPETSAPQGGLQVYEYTTLTLKSDPTFTDGVFVLYFNESNISFDEDTTFYLGVRAESEAYTITADSETASYEDMIVDGKYCGIAIRPTMDIAAGTYRFSVTFNEYLCEFEMTIE